MVDFNNEKLCILVPRLIFFGKNCNWIYLNYLTGIKIKTSFVTGCGSNKSGQQRKVELANANLKLCIAVFIFFLN